MQTLARTEEAGVGAAKRLLGIGAEQNDLDAIDGLALVPLVLSERLRSIDPQVNDLGPVPSAIGDDEKEL